MPLRLIPLLFISLALPLYAEMSAPHFSIGLEMGVTMPSIGGMTQRVGMGFEGLIRFGSGRFGVGLYKYSSSKEELAGTMGLSMQGIEFNWLTITKATAFRIGGRIGKATLTYTAGSTSEATTPASRAEENAESGGTSESSSSGGSNPTVTTIGPVISYDLFFTEDFSLGGKIDGQFVPSFTGIPVNNEGFLFNFLVSLRYWF